MNKVINVIIYAMLTIFGLYVLQNNPQIQIIANVLFITIMIFAGVTNLSRKYYDDYIRQNDKLFNEQHNLILKLIKDKAKLLKVIKNLKEENNK